MFNVILFSFFPRRVISSSPAVAKQAPNNLKGKNVSSQKWLIRQLKDPYVEKAKLENYRCRSAFKLLEIDSRFRLFHPGQCVIDCGASPGSWIQVVVPRVNANGKDNAKSVGTVIGVDKLSIYPIEGALLLGNVDFTLPETQGKVKELAKGGADVMLSDMAPNATGVRSMDHEAIIRLVYSFVRFSLSIGRKGGSLVAKVWEGGMTHKLENDLRRFYSSVHRFKPSASRSDSSEFFFVATNFKGIQKM